MTNSIAVLGAGAFGTALAISLARHGRQTLLWGRPSPAMREMIDTRVNARHLPGVSLPSALHLSDDLADLPPKAVVLLAVPTQSLRALLQLYAGQLQGHMLVCCCKGVERGTGLLPSEVVGDVLPNTPIAVLTGPSFAADIAQGKPTALTLALATAGEDLQHLLSTPDLRLYLSHDLVGAQLGGALKNVIAIAAGISIGAGLGESARSALMTRGFAEMGRYVTRRGGQRATLFGLAGFGDLVLTCTSTQSRNLRHGLAVGAGQPIDPTLTVEGVMTAHAVVEAAGDLDLPVTQMVSAVLKGDLTLAAAIAALMQRPLRQEDEEPF